MTCGAGQCYLQQSEALIQMFELLSFEFVTGLSTDTALQWNLHCPLIRSTASRGRESLT